MGKYRISLDSTVFVNANDEQSAIEKFNAIFEQFDKVLKDAKGEVEFVKYIINVTESD